MCRHSEEGNVDCLNIFDVDVKRFIPARHEDKIPHMGWNSLEIKQDDPIFKYVKDGEKLAWGNKDRDGIYLDYTINFGEKQYAIKDTLVSRSREIKLETYIPTYQE